MASDDQASGTYLLEHGTLVELTVLEEDVIPGTDEGECGVRIRLHLGGEEDDKDVERVGLGFMFVFAMLSFADARPRGMSEAEFRRKEASSLS